MSLKASLDSILRHHFGGDLAAPGVQVTIVNDQQILYEGAIGLANPVEDDEQLLTTRHQANLYSCSKFFTACCLLKLAQNSKLQLDDKACSFLPPNLREFVPDDVTVKQMVAHQAGAPNPLPITWVHTPEVDHDEMTCLTRILHDNPIRRRQRTYSYLYSNIGYWLLGPVVTTACEAKLQDFTLCCRQLLQLPAAISNRFQEDENADSNSSHMPMSFGHVHRWSFWEFAARFFCPKQILGPASLKWLRMQPHYLDGVAYGGLVGSSRDVASWLIRLLRGDVLSAEWISKLFTQLNREMTFGLHIRPHRGMLLYHKEGGGPGHHSSIQIRPHRGPLAGCIIAQDAGFDVDTLMNELIDCVEDYQQRDIVAAIDMESKSVTSADRTRLQTYLFRANKEATEQEFVLMDGTILLIHGGPGVPDYLSDLARLLIHHRVAPSVVTFDQRGVGLSKMGDITMHLLIDDIEAIRQAYSLEQIHVVGHSWGGILARFYAQTHPEQLASLVLLSPTTVHQSSDWYHMESAVMKYNLAKGRWWRFAQLGLWSLLIHMPFIKKVAARSLFRLVVQNYYPDPFTAPEPSCKFLDGVSPDTMLLSKKAFLHDVDAPLLLPAKRAFRSLVIFGQHDIYGDDLATTFCQRMEREDGVEQACILQGASHQAWVDQPIALIHQMNQFYVTRQKKDE